VIGILGGYQTHFGERFEVGLDELILEASMGAIKDAGIKKEAIDLVIVGNKLSGKIVGQDHLGSLTTTLLGLTVPGFRVEAACASGGVAVNQAVQAIKAGSAKTVLVVGAEKMTDKSNGGIAAALMGAGSEDERRAGLSFVGLYALMARSYMEKFGAERRDLARVAVKNHRQAVLNTKAQFRREITEEMVLLAMRVAEPLGLLDCSPITDGAAAVVISKDRGKVEIVASEIATDSLSLSERKSLTGLEATQEASRKAYKSAQVEVKEIEIAEVHDCFTIAEILALEDLGICIKGEGYKGVKIPINTSGGLKACGHPVGATGVKQVVEIYKQLSGQAEERQVKGVSLGLTHNVGGTGGTVVVNILRKI
jgi:acetyl-CoA C-acetyltransferase